VVDLAVASLDHNEGRLERARERIEHARTLLEQCGDRRGAALALTNLGSTACAARDYTAAAGYLARSLSIASEMGEPTGIALVLDAFATLATVQGQSSRALRLAGAAAALREEAQLQLLPAAQRRLEAQLEPARRALSRTAGDVFRAGRAFRLSEAVAEALAVAQERSSTSAAHGRHGLSRREMEVVALVGRGYTNRQIAEELVIGEATVATHLMHIRTKLDVVSRAQVAAWAARHGILDEHWQTLS
jgi:DNA-binding CsgD family transcriptional regulator